MPTLRNITFLNRIFGLGSNKQPLVCISLSRDDADEIIIEQKKMISSSCTGKIRSAAVLTEYLAMMMSKLSKSK